MNRVNWTAVVIASLVVIVVLMIGASLLGGWGYGGYRYGAWGMMGPWMMGGMFFMWLFPLGFLVLIALGIAWVVKSLYSGSNSNASALRCPSCGRSVQPDWKNCPHCGTTLAK